jgi:hypothetical protein
MNQSGRNSYSQANPRQLAMVCTDKVEIPENRAFAMMTIYSYTNTCTINLWKVKNERI